MTDTTRTVRRPAIEPMKAERVQARVELLAGWEMKAQGRAIERVYRHVTPEAASRFADFAGQVARDLGATPVLRVDDAEVTVTARTREAGGVTEADFNLAEWLDQKKVG